MPAAFQIKSESFLEDVNNILNSGDVPNLYNGEEQERIMTAMKPVVQDLGMQPTKANLMAAYIRRVRSNIHTVLCMRSGLFIKHSLLSHLHGKACHNEIHTLELAYHCLLFSVYIRDTQCASRKG